MVDRLTPAARSALMSRVKGKNTSPEMLVRSILHRAGYRFSLHKRGLPGSPDIFLARHRTAIFVHGCFWHGHPNCSRAKLPETRKDFWETKIGRNMERDSVTQHGLEQMGYRVLVLWGCELKNESAARRELAKYFPKVPLKDGEAIANS